MRKKTQRWRPDTCGCEIIETWWDFESPAEELRYKQEHREPYDSDAGKVGIGGKPCPEHISVFNPPADAMRARAGARSDAEALATMHGAAVLRDHVVREVQLKNRAFNIAAEHVQALTETQPSGEMVRRPDRWAWEWDQQRRLRFNLTHASSAEREAAEAAIAEALPTQALPASESQIVLFRAQRALRVSRYAD